MSPFLLHQMLTLFSTINLAFLLETNIFGRDYLNLRHMKKGVMVMQVSAFKNFDKQTPAYKDY